MIARDNWGWRARIGIFIVGNEAVPEAEWWAMAPPDVSIHAARVTAKSPWPLDGDLKRGAEQFATMKIDAAVLAHTTSSIVGGKGWDEKMAADLAAIGGDGGIVRHILWLEWPDAVTPAEQGAA